MKMFSPKYSSGPEDSSFDNAAKNFSLKVRKFFCSKFQKIYKSMFLCPEISLCTKKKVFATPAEIFFAQILKKESNIFVFFSKFFLLKMFP